MNHWSNTFFEEAYQRVYADRTLEQARSEATFFYEEAGLNPDSRVLDVGCGTGLHLAALSSLIAQGVGIDTSSTQLGSAQTLKEEMDLENIEFLDADMRVFSSDQQFDAVTFFFTTFGYFTDEENAEVLSRCRDLLKPGGVLFLDVQNVEMLKRRFGDGGQGNTRRMTEDIEGEEVVIKQWVDWETKRLHQRITSDPLDMHLEGDWRVYTQNELTELLEQQGFEVCSWKGGYAGEVFGAESRRMLVFAKKK